MKLYIAGPMRGIRFFNFPAFDEARDSLMSIGYEIISPADLDRASGDSDVVEIDKRIPDYNWTDFKLLEDFGFKVSPVRDMVRRDFEAIMSVDGLYMLQGWEKSTGARAEHAVAVWLGLRIIYQ